MRKKVFCTAALAICSLAFTSCCDAASLQDSTETDTYSPETVSSVSEEAEILTEISYFSFSYSSGDYAYAGCRYAASLDDGVVTVSVQTDGSPDEVTFTAGPEFMDTLTDIANEYKISAWDDFNESDDGVLDGDSFYLHLETDSGQEVSAGGYACYPQNYRNASNALEQPFVNLYESYYPNQQAILQVYLDEVIIPLHGMASTDDISYPYLAAEGPDGESGYFTRAVYDGDPGVIAYCITDIDDDYKLIVYYFEPQDDSWQLGFEYYGLDDDAMPVLLGNGVLDDDALDNDGLYSFAFRSYDYENDIYRIIYSGNKTSINGTGSESYFLKSFILDEDGVTPDGEAEVTGSTDRSEWTQDTIADLVQLAEDCGLSEESSGWEESPYDPVLHTLSRDVEFLTSTNDNPAFNDVLAETEIGESIGDYKVSGQVICSIDYGYEGDTGRYQGMNSIGEEITPADDTDLTLLVDYCEKSISGENGDGYSEIVLYRDDSDGSYQLHTYSQSGGSEEIHHAYKADKDIAEKAFALIGKLGLAACENADGIGIDGAEYVVKFLQDGRIVRVSTDNMGEDGQELLSLVGDFLYGFL